MGFSVVQREVRENQGEDLKIILVIMIQSLIHQYEVVFSLTQIISI